MDLEPVLYKTFYQLVLEKGVAKVTVADITNRSGVSRATFYRHFADKYELMNFGLQRFFEHQHYQPGSDPSKLIMALLGYIKENRDYFRKIANVRTQNSLYQFLTDYCSRLTERTAQRQSHQKHLDYHSKETVNYIISGSLAVTFDWIRNDYQEPVGDVMKVLVDNIPIKF